MFQLARTRRPRRAGDWTEAKAVTFIVTLAARQSVTLAARAAGMSRKSAYALRARNFAFATAWKSALAVAVQGDKVREVNDPPFSTQQGDAVPRHMSLDQFHEILSRWRSESGMELLAPGMTLP